ncbi:MAG: TcpQ domain-containing protein [Alphaproteobacteria bacterium]|nr:TcpQ domain-containing protein [Alphaproteobacteria bacterium]
MYHRSSSISNFVFLSCLLAVGVMCVPTSAHAGFQWVAPSDSSESTSAPSVVTEPAPTLAPYLSSPAQKPASNALRSPARDSEVISPIVIDGGNAAPVVSDAAAPVAQSEEVPVTSPSAAAAPTPLLAAQSENYLSVKPLSKDKIVTGFANKVPLAVALRQIMPPDYGFSVDRDVPFSTPVSWRGGKSWREVMGDMLKPAGLGMHEQGQMVRIVRSSADITPSAAVASTSSAALGDVGQTASTAPSLQPLSSVGVSSSPSLAPVKNVSEHTLQLPPGMVEEVAPSSAPMIESAAEPVQPIAVVETWTANRGDMLRKTLEDWAKRAKVECNWLAEYDYPIQASISVTGSFEDAVRNILAGFQEAKPQPVARLHNSPTAGQTVLVVESRGDSYND